MRRTGLRPGLLCTGHYFLAGEQGVECAGAGCNQGEIPEGKRRG